MLQHPAGQVAADRFEHVIGHTHLGIFYLLEQGTHATNHGDAHDLTEARRAGLWGATGVGIHSLLDGVAIGEAFQAGAAVGWIVALAVVVHKFADGVSTVGMLISTINTGWSPAASIRLRGWAVTSPATMIGPSIPRLRSESDLEHQREASWRAEH